MIANKRIFITGGTGFIGTNLVNHFHHNNEITVYDNLVNDYLLTTHPYQKYPYVNIIEGDILDKAFLSKEIQNFNPHIVIHCAAIIGIKTVTINTVNTIETNLIGTYNLLSITRDLPKLEKFINFSTSEVGGIISYLTKEDDINTIGAVGNDRWVYAASKLAAEHLTYSYYKQYDVPTITIRPFNVYGPGQSNEGAMMFFVKNALANMPLQIHGDGNQIRSWCYIDDFVQGIKKAIVSPHVGEVFNLGNPKEIYTIYNLAKKIIKLTNSKSGIDITHTYSPDVHLRTPNIISGPPESNTTLKSFQCKKCNKEFEDVVERKTKEMISPCCNVLSVQIIKVPQFFIKGSYRDNTRLDGGVPFGEVPGDEDYEGIEDNQTQGKIP